MRRLVLLPALALLLAGCHVPIGPAVDDPDVPGDQSREPAEFVGPFARGGMGGMTESGSHMLWLELSSRDLGDAEPSRCVAFLDGRHPENARCTVKPPETDGNGTRTWRIDASMPTYDPRESVVVYDAEGRAIAHWLDFCRAVQAGHAEDVNAVCD